MALAPVTGGDGGGDAEALVGRDSRGGEMPGEAGPESGATKAGLSLSTDTVQGLPDRNKVKVFGVRPSTSKGPS